MWCLIQLWWTFAHLSLNGNILPPFVILMRPPFRSTRLGLFWHNRDIICFTIAESALTRVVRNLEKKLNGGIAWTRAQRGGGMDGVEGKRQMAQMRRRTWSAPGHSPADDCVQKHFDLVVVVTRGRSTTDDERRLKEARTIKPLQVWWV